MKNYLLTLFLSASCLFSIAQIEVNHVATFNELSFLEVNQLPNGNFIAMSHGAIDSSPNNINTIIENDGNWTVTDACDQVDWPASHLFCVGTHFVSDNEGIAVMAQHNGGYGTPGIFKTEDGGSSWIRILDFESNNGLDGPVRMEFFDELNGVIIVANYLEGMTSFLWKTSDGGNSWTILHQGDFLGVNFEALDIIGSQSFMVTGTVFDADFEVLGWKVFKFDNFGETYEEVIETEGTLVEAVDIEFVSESVGFLALHTPDVNEYDQIHRTNDGGLTWTPLPEYSDVMEERMYIQQLYFFNELDGFALLGEHCDDFGCNRGGALLHTIDGGQSWDVSYKNTVDGFDFWKMAFDLSTGKGILVGGDIDNTDGVIYEVEYLDFVDTSNIPSTDNSSFFEIYPNPSNGRFSIHFDKIVGKTNLKIHDVQGKLVRQENIQEGRYDFLLPIGVYTYQIVSGDNVNNGKIIVAK